MIKPILRVLKDFFSWRSFEFESSEAFRDLEEKKTQMRILIQSRLL